MPHHPNGNGNGNRQEERSAATRAKLLQATYECLLENGYSGTSTPEVLKRCGVSRGAMLHHYPTRADLVAGALEYVMQMQLDEFEAGFEELPEDADRAVSAIELMWRPISNSTYYAWLELVVASRTDPELRAKVREVNAGLEERIGSLYKKIFPRTPESRSLERMYKQVPDFAFAVLTGLAITRIYMDPERIDRGVESVKQLAAMVDEFYRGD